MDNSILISKEEYSYLKSLSKKATVIKIEKALIPPKTKKIRNNYDPGLPGKYKQYLQRANLRKIEFNLSIEIFDSIREKPCHYCGDTENNGIDRMNSNEGYTIENSVSCCSQCNTMKFVHSEEKFLLQVEKIYNYRIYTAPNHPKEHF